MLKEQIEKYADSITHGLFADRENIQEAIKFSDELASICYDPRDKQIVYTAMYVCLNTISKELKRISEENNLDLCPICGSKLITKRNGIKCSNLNCRHWCCY